MRGGTAQIGAETVPRAQPGHSARQIIVRLSDSDTAKDSDFHVHRIAGRDLLVNRRVPELGPFAAEGSESRRMPCALRSGEDYRTDRVYAGPGLVADTLYKLECRRGTAGYELDFSGKFSFRIAGDGSAIHQKTGAAEGLAEILLGPVLTLALALQNTWCLHAGAVVGNGKAVAVVGVSGSGKSTVSSSLLRLPEMGVARGADDILPLEQGPEGVSVLPHFPQLKLGPRDQYPNQCPARVPLCRLYALDPVCDSGTPLEVAALSPLEGFAALLRNTVAARLFDRQILERHADFGMSLLARVPTHRIVYPHSRKSLQEIGRRILADLGAPVT